MSWFDKLKNYVMPTVIKVGEQFTPPPENDVFQINGELSPDEFIRAGDKLTSICSDWKWQPSLSAYQSKYLTDKNKQYLILEKVISKKRLNTKESQKEIEQKIVTQNDGEIIILNSPESNQQPEKEQDYRYYKMYIIYDQFYHTPRMFFSATGFDGKVLSNQAIAEDIQKQYLDKTLTVEPFKFIDGLSMPTVHPCRHAAVLKTMSDSMVEGGHKVESHFALLIFLKFITSVIPTVEFDMTGDLIFK